MSFELTQEEGEFLVQLARSTVKQYLEDGKTAKAAKGYTPKNVLELRRVCNHKQPQMAAEKELRGCIGYPYPTSPLIEAVIDSAINAATEDPRFEPITLEELDKVVFEVSVLTPPERVEIENPKEYVKQNQSWRRRLNHRTRLPQRLAFASSAQSSGVGLKKNFSANAA